ncbi:T9SS type A sorting domain-containing protein [candidate division KSB1 bacterium]|nr:T9SS type A sorting domain-containing protein [candidate division KSB1 bacterium]
MKLTYKNVLHIYWLFLMTVGLKFTTPINSHAAIDFYPRLIITPSQIPEAKSRYNNVAYQTLRDDIIVNSETPIGGNDWHNYAINAQTAQAAAFRYLVGDSIDVDGDHLGDKTVQILLSVPVPDSVLPANLNELIFSDGVNKLLEASKAITGYCTAWDLLKGSGYHFGDAEIASATRIQAIVRKLYNKSVNDFKVYELSYFNNNVDLKVASAIGIAGIVFDTYPDATDWVFHAYLRYYKIFDVQSTDNGGWAEGFDYLEYAAASFIPFVWTHFIINNETKFGGAAQSEFDPGIILDNPTFQSLAEWSIRIRMPDGRRPNFDDGRYDGYFTGITAAIDNNGLFQWDYQHTLTDLDFQNDLYEIRLMTKMPNQQIIDPVTAGWESSQFMPDQGLAILRTDWSPDATYMALIGEHDDMRKWGMSHEQADATSFIIARGSDVLALDSGYDQFGNHDLFNKASDHNRIAIENEELINQTYSIINAPDLDAYIENYISIGDIDYLEISIRESTNPENTNPVLIGPNTTRHVIYDRSYAYDNDPSTDPYFIIVDRVTNDHGAPKNFIWRLHGHQQQTETGDSPNEIVWNNIGDGQRASQLKAYVTTVSGRESISIEDDTHADAWKSIENHKVMTARLTLAHTETDRFLSIVQPGAANAVLPHIQDLSVALNVTKKLVIGNDDNIIIVQNEPSFFTMCCPSVEVKEMSIDANIFFAKLTASHAAPKFVLAQNATQIVFNSIPIFSNDGIPGCIILNYNGNKITGYYSSTAATSAQLHIYTGVPPAAFKNIEATTAAYKDGITSFALPLHKEHATSSYYKATFELEGVNLAGIPVEFDQPNTTPGAFALFPNYPNPFNPATTIRYTIPQTDLVTLTIYDVLGKEIETVVNQRQSAGTYRIGYDGSSLASGIYLYQLRMSNFVATRKFVLMK